MPPSPDAPDRPATWPAFAQARARHGPPRVPFVLGIGPGDRGRRRVLGSVSVADVDALARFPDVLVLEGAANARTVVLRPGDRAWRDGRLAEVHRVLRDEGRIAAWRDEPYPLRDVEGGEHGIVERASSRFWGLLTFGAHANGYVADASGRPTLLWIARRARSKPTDPGKLDNLVGGGVPAGQTPDEALVREGWEEAGLTPGDMVARVAGGVLSIDADIPEGRQLEWLFVFDLVRPAGWAPRAIDGEVDEHLLLPVDEALARAAAGEMTTDAALATLDFALRHRVAGSGAATLARSLDALRVSPS